MASETISLIEHAPNVHDNGDDMMTAMTTKLLPANAATANDGNDEELWRGFVCLLVA